jgi:hypothetical protein
MTGRLSRVGAAVTVVLEIPSTHSHKFMAYRGARQRWRVRREYDYEDEDEHEDEKCKAKTAGWKERSLSFKKCMP